MYTVAFAGRCYITSPRGFGHHTTATSSTVWQQASTARWSTNHGQAHTTRVRACFPYLRRRARKIRSATYVQGGYVSKEDRGAQPSTGRWSHKRKFAHNRDASGRRETVTSVYGAVERVTGESQHHDDDRAFFCTTAASSEPTTESSLERSVLRSLSTTLLWNFL